MTFIGGPIEEPSDFDFVEWLKNQPCGYNHVAWLKQERLAKSVNWTESRRWTGTGKSLDFEIRERPDDLGGPTGLRYDVFCRQIDDEDFAHAGNHCSLTGAMALAVEAETDD